MIWLRYGGAGFFIIIIFKKYCINLNPELFKFGFGGLIFQFDWEFKFIQFEIFRFYLKLNKIIWFNL